MNIFNLAKQVKKQTDDLDKEINKLPKFAYKRFVGNFFRSTSNDDEMLFDLRLSSKWSGDDSIHLNMNQLKKLKGYLNKLNLD